MADTAARLSEDWLGWVSSKGHVDDCCFFLLLLGSSYEDICGWGGQGSVQDATRFSAGRGVLRLQAATRQGRCKKKKEEKKVTLLAGTKSACWRRSDVQHTFLDT